jgi:site-specific recombinase XerD
MSELVSSGGAGERRLTSAEFQQLASVPAAVEWFANIDNPRTRRAYQNDLEDFCSFVGLTGADEFRAVTRAHVLAWRAQLETRGLAGATIRRKLAALASLFDHLLENNAVAGGNPVHGVKRPKIETNEGKTPALGDDQAKRLLDAPDTETVKGVRDRAILAVLLYHGLRREEAARLTMSDLVERRGIKHLRVHGKGKKIRFLPLHPVAAERIYAYLERDSVRDTSSGPLFRSVRGKTTGAGVTANGLYTVVAHWARVAGIEVDGLGVHGLRATAATNALDHANISTTRLYDRRGQRPEDSPTYKVKY